MPQLEDVRWLARRAGVSALRQAIRVGHPLTVGRALWAVLRGLGRSLVLLAGYIRGTDLADLRVKHPAKHLEVRKDRHRIVAVVVLVTLAALGLLAWRWPAATCLVGAGLLAGLFALGRKGKVMVDPPKLDAAPMEELVRQAFVDAGLAKSIDLVRVLAPGVQRDKAAWTATVELPSGKTSRKAQAKRPELASAFEVGTIQLDLLKVAGNERRLKVWCADGDPWSGKPVASPLVRRLGPFDLWRPEGVPLGEDARRHEVAVPVVFSGLLVGGLPRFGKTVLANNVLVAAMLDVHCRISLADGKGLDSAPIVPLAHRVANHTPASLIDLLDEMLEEMYRRIAVLQRLGMVKLSREVCHDGNPLELLWIDELAVFTANADKRAAGIITAKLRDLASVGPALGVIPLLCTQRPSSTVVDPDLRDNIPTRAALRCSTWQTSNTVLGDGAATQGYNAAELGDEHRGVVILRQGPGGQTIRSYFVDVDDVRKVARYATDLRRRHGVLSDPTTRAVPAILAAMHRAMEAGEGVDRMPTAALLDVLRAADPVQWGDLDPTSLANLVRPHGLGPKQLGGEGNPRGYRLDDLQAAIDRMSRR
ncbi:FtsK/SpoIIIE domain-containing protein [Micromonosporaceae bacterium B7E4]